MNWWRRDRRGSRGSWADRLKELKVPEGGSTQDLMAAISLWRGRELVLLDDAGITVASGPCGLWLASETLDVIWVDPAAKGVHADKILAHELGHMINDDEPHHLDMETLFSVAVGGFKHLSPELVASALARTSYERPEEQRAEEFSTWFTARGEDQRSNSTTDPLLNNMRATLDTRGEFW